MRYFLVVVLVSFLYGCSTPVIMALFGGSIITGKAIENNNKRNAVKPVIEKEHTVTVVLLEDDDGHVGKVEVFNNGGSQVIDKANEYTVVKHIDTKPTPPVAASDDMLKATYAGLFSAQPIRPITFLLYFDSATTYIDQESAMLIPDIIKAARKRDPAEIKIIGHADRAGNDQFNIDLSIQRAETILKMLELESIKNATFHVSSHGENDPLIETEDGVAEAKNRRVEVIVR